MILQDSSGIPEKDAPKDPGDHRAAEVQRLSNLGSRPAIRGARHLLLRVPRQPFANPSGLSRPPPRPARRAVPAGQHSCHDLASTPGYRQGTLTVVIRVPLSHLATESSAMLQLLLVLLGRMRRGAPHVRGSGLPLMSLAVVVVGCASPSLLPEVQAVAIQDRDRALALHADAIHAAISQSAKVGALVFLDAKDSHLVVLPGESPADAWARYTMLPENGTGRVSMPPVLTFVHRADVPKAPETIPRSALQQQAQLRDAWRRIEERLSIVQSELAESKREADASLTGARADMQAALSSLAEDLAAVRKFMLQTAQLGSLNHELNVETETGLRKVATASQELSASSARLEEIMRELPERLAGQLKELANRLDTIQGKVSSLK
jgi:hypothetical protein